MLRHLDAREYKLLQEVSRFDAAPALAVAIHCEEKIRPNYRL